MHSIDRYDTSAMAADIVDFISDTVNAEISEPTMQDDGSHAFSIVTPSGLKFTVTVTEG